MSNNCLHINSARHVRNFLVDVAFDDGTKIVVDVTPLLTGEVFEPLKDQQLFAKLTIDPVSRTIVWPNGADLAPGALYELPAVEQVA